MPSALRKCLSPPIMATSTRISQKMALVGQARSLTTMRRNAWQHGTKSRSCCKSLLPVAYAAITRMSIVKSCSRAEFANLLREGTFPAQRVSNNGRKVIKVRLPAKRLTDQPALGHDLGRIPRPACCIYNCEIDA
jgi:hypothetical protein